MSESPTIEAVDFYWRPGCGFCVMLERGLNKAGVPLARHDIWADPAAAAIVRGWADGNETVPTVVVDDIGLVNPSTDQVIALLATRAPGLVPEGREPAQPGRLATTMRRVLGG